MATWACPLDTDVSAIISVALQTYTKRCHLKAILLVFWFCAFPPHVIQKDDESKGSLGKDTRLALELLQEALLHLFSLCLMASLELSARLELM